MAARALRPRWINLEYLSAEEWVESSHALPSPHPRLPLVKHYFFPGFTPRTGGLLREKGLIERRDAFQDDAGARAAFWTSLVGKAPGPDTLKLSLFTYAGAALETLARRCDQYPGPVWLVATEGAAAAGLSGRIARAGSSIRRNDHPGGMRREVEVFTVPFLHQDRYDQLLWGCDMNFVRGEDSFVRAQWAARPFAWQIYPTDDGAHWVKMAAFLARYTAGLERGDAAAVTALWEAWNRDEAASSEGSAWPAVAVAWPDFIARRERLLGHAKEWAAGLSERADLAAALVDFADNVLK